MGREANEVFPLEGGAGGCPSGELRVLCEPDIPRSLWLLPPSKGESESPATLSGSQDQASGFAGGT